MKILILVDDFLPSSTKIAAKMMHDLALFYAQGIHEVTVLTPEPPITEKYLIKSIDGVKVICFRSGRIKNTTKIKRALNESMLPFYAWRALKKSSVSSNIDYVIYYSPTIFWGLFVKRLKEISNAKSYLVLRDIFPQWTVDNGLMRKGSLIYRYFRFFEKISYKNADCIGLMTKAALNQFKENNKVGAKLEVLPNWSRINLKSNSSADSTYRDLHGLKGKVVFFFGGNIGHAQNMISLVRLARRLDDNPEAHFLFVGNGDEVNLLLDEKQKHNLTNLTYLPSVDQDTYFKMLNEFDIGIFSLHPDHTTHNFPGKLLGYMDASKPIIGYVNQGNDLIDIINNSGAGKVHIAGDEGGLADSAMMLLNSPALRSEMGQAAKKLLIENYSVEAAGKKILESLFEKA